MYNYNQGNDTWTEFWDHIQSQGECCGWVFLFSIGDNITECRSIEVNEIHSALKICFNLTFQDSPWH